MHKDTLAARFVVAELADRFEEGQALDVAHRAADFAQHKVDLVIADMQEILDLVGDVGNHLNGLAQIVAATLFLEHGGIDPTRADRIRLACRDAGKAFVVAQIQIGFGTIVGHENFAMFKGRHRAGIDVQVRVQFAQTDGKATRLQQGPQRRRGKAFAKAGNHTTGDENIACHVMKAPVSSDLMRQKPSN